MGTDGVIFSCCGAVAVEVSCLSANCVGGVVCAVALGVELVSCLSADCVGGVMLGVILGVVEIPMLSPLSDHLASRICDASSRLVSCNGE